MISEELEKFPEQFGMKWRRWKDNLMPIGINDWLFIESILNKYDVYSVLEFGCGISTLCFRYIYRVGFLKVYEKDEKYRNFIINHIEITARTKILPWDGELIDNIFNKSFDLAFVDGPFGGMNRGPAVEMATKTARYVILHDADTEESKHWQSIHLENDEWEFVDQGGEVEEGRILCKCWRRI
jgi:hypothetical protein